MTLYDNLLELSLSSGLGSSLGSGQVWPTSTTYKLENLKGSTPINGNSEDWTRIEQGYWNYICFLCVCITFNYIQIRATILPYSVDSCVSQNPKGWFGSGHQNIVGILIENIYSITEKLLITLGS